MVWGNNLGKTAFMRCKYHSVRYVCAHFCPFYCSVLRTSMKPEAWGLMNANWIHEKGYTYRMWKIHLRCNSPLKTMCSELGIKARVLYWDACSHQGTTAEAAVFRASPEARTLHFCRAEQSSAWECLGAWWSGPRSSVSLCLLCDPGKRVTEPLGLNFPHLWNLNDDKDRSFEKRKKKWTRASWQLRQKRNHDVWSPFLKSQCPTEGSTSKSKIF